MANGRPDYRQGTDLEAQTINRLKIISKNPATATNIAKSHIATDATGIIHTVPAGKTLYLTAASMAIGALDVAGTGYLAIRNDSDVIQYYLLRHNAKATTDNSANIAFALPLNPPVEIPAGWDMVAFSPASNFSTSVSISGWEE